MTKKNGTKRSLLMSVLALVLCFSMLIGSTFAWFTDSVTSGNNIIKSGTLDVTMGWADGTKAVPAADSTDWADASTGAIFNYEKWEPGYVQVRHIKIANEGTLALKYQLNIVANGTVSELADVIDVYFVDPAAQAMDRTLAGMTNIGTLTNVLANMSTTASGNLQPNESHTVTLALKMQETAGNEYQDLAIGADFAVQLLATQLTAETDSFGDQYDQKAWDEVMGTIVPDANGVVYVYTPEQLAAIGATDGVKVVELGADIDLAGRLWTPIKINSGYSSLTINGNGHSIKNMTIVETEKGTTMTTYGTGFIGNAYAGKLAISDLTFENASVTGKGDYVGTVVGYAYYCDVALDNVAVVDSYVTSKQWNAKAIGGLIGNKHMINGSGAATAEGFTVKECSVTDTTVVGYSMVSGLVGALPYCDYMTDDTFQNCALTGSTVLAYYNMPMEYLAVNTVLPVSDDDFTVTDSVLAPRIGSSNVTTSNTQLASSVQNYDVVYLGKDYTFDLKGCQKDGVTLIGMGNTKLANTTDYASSGNLGAIWQKMNFENLTITNTVYTMADGGESTFKNVTFAAGVRQAYGKNVKFTDCTFGSNSEGYALHFQTDSASAGGVITLTGCEFEGGKVHLGGKRAYEFTNCDFASGTDFQVWSNITLDGCTVDGVEVTSANAAEFFPNLNLEKVTFN